MKTLKQLLMLLTCLAVLAAGALQQNGKLFGYDVVSDKDTTTVENVKTEKMQSETDSVDAVQTLDNGTIIINTTSLCQDVRGYNGPVPILITVKDGVVEELKSLPNDETPDFYEDARVILQQWKGKTVEEAQALQVDVVSGATFSSNAIIANVRAGLAKAADSMVVPENDGNGWSLKSILGLIVVLMAAAIPLFFKNKTMRVVQMILNVAVLGLWCGTFLNYTFFLQAMSSGLSLPMQVIPAIMIIVAFIYPLFGKKQHYCANVCPFGSLQDLAGKATKKKMKLSKKALDVLTWFRRILWIVLMILMVSGIWADWMDYELFIAFMFNVASGVVIILAVICVILSFFTPRPYCRFVCPTGTLLKFSEGQF